MFWYTFLIESVLIRALRVRLTKEELNHLRFVDLSGNFGNFWWLLKNENKTKMSFRDVRRVKSFNRRWGEVKICDSSLSYSHVNGKLSLLLPKKVFQFLTKIRLRKFFCDEVFGLFALFLNLKMINAEDDIVISSVFASSVSNQRCIRLLIVKYLSTMENSRHKLIPATTS